VCVAQVFFYKNIRRLYVNAIVELLRLKNWYFECFKFIVCQF